jgi:hypothetical protein
MAVGLLRSYQVSGSDRECLRELFGGVWSLERRLEEEVWQQRKGDDT